MSAATPPSEDQSAAEGIVDLYERHAAAWAGARGTRLWEGAWLQPFLAMVAPHGHVLDLGCGSGAPIASHLVERGRRVTGVDGSGTMIGMCRGLLPAQTWVVADMRGLALGRRFDGIVAWDSFFHLSHADQRGMVPVFRAHARPGAPLLFTSGPAHGVATGALEGEPLFHASLAPAEYRALLEAEGFDVVRHVAEDPACGGHTVWLAQAR